MHTNRNRRLDDDYTYKAYNSLSNDGDVDDIYDSDPYDEELETPRVKFVNKFLMAINITIAFVLSFYFVVVFTEAPLISDARDIWIETAMTTMEHQWLATSFFPRWLIDRVMDRQVITDEDTLSNPDLVHAFAAVKGTQAIVYGGVTDGKTFTGTSAGGGSSSGIQTGIGAQDNQSGSPDGVSGDGADSMGSQQSKNGSGFSFFNAAENSGSDQPSFQLPDIGFFNGFSYQKSDDYLDMPPMFPAVGDIDEFGNTVILSDKDEELYIVEIRKNGYTGRILFVSDPSRVVVRNTKKKNVQGELLKSFLKEYDAIAGMNGNGFDDPEGHGKGGTIIGWSVADGVEWGSGPKSAYASIGFNDQHVLLAGTIKNFEAHNIRDLAQYGPSLIVDGKKLISGSGGWGLQPRSGIGQREDGTILMATFDGRQPGHSLGITAGDVADILMQYGCINAGLCDGGSSSVMMYDGDVIGKPSTPMKDTGRYLPNAFLVLRKPVGPSADTVTPAAASPAIAEGSVTYEEKPIARSSET